ncbi:MAG: hypothetical protein WC696_12540 [Candidatus Methylopumilus sp.]|jgi:hypothetical protein
MSFKLYEWGAYALRKLRQHPAVGKFIEHNKRVFSQPVPTARQRVVLLELNTMQSAHIAYSYLANALATEHQAQIKAYRPGVMDNWRRKLFFNIEKMANRNEWGVYRSFGVTDFFGIAPTAVQKDKARALYTEIMPRLKTTLDIEALTVNGVWMGDLIYDTFLMGFKKPTIDRESPVFQGFLLEALEQFVFWQDYFDNNDVRAVNVSHCVYTLAIPLRIAVQRGIQAYQGNATHMYRLRPDNLFAYNDFVYFPERFAALPPDMQAAGIAEAKRRIEKRFAGQVGVDMAYSTKSAYGSTRHAQLLKPSPRKKILIATHCFFDSPHSYGNNIFPDFYEWLDFLGRMTEEADYDWYIKTHPDYLPGTKEIIDSFVAKYPRFTLLPADASHHQIIAEGIDCALTAYGTIAFEYAALGIPVINASQNNPHIAYDFNLHARDVAHYRALLTKLERLDLKIDKEKVYEYYFMRYIFNTENLFFDNYDAAVNDLGGYELQFTPTAYSRWLREWSPEKHRDVAAALLKFIRSGDFRMDYRHYGREFTVKSMERRS